MEKNIVIIGLEEYTGLIKDIESYKRQILCLEEEIKNVKNEESIVYNTLFEKIYNNEQYYLKGLLADKTREYYRDELINEFKKYGFYSLDFINDKINLMLEKLESEENDEKDN